MVDEAAPRVRADDQPGDAQAVPVLVHVRWRDVVVEATPVVPGQEDRGAVPVGALHDRVDQARHVGLARGDQPGRVLRHRPVGDDPGDRRQGSRLRRGEEVRQRLDVGQLVVLLDVGEVRQRVPDAGCLGALANRSARHGRVVVAVGFGPLEHVIGPADAVAVHQVGQIGPRVVGIGRVFPAEPPREVGWVLGALHRVAAAHRVALLGAVGRPLRHHVQVRGEAPGEVGLEHVVLEHEVARIRPVIGDVRAGVVAHHVGRATGATTGRVERLGAAGHPLVLLGHEPVHVAPVDVGLGVGVAVRSAEVAVLAIMEGLDAAAGRGVGEARHRPRVPRQPWDPVRPGIGPEVGVERAVLLHDDHDVADLVDADGRRRRPDGRGRERVCGGALGLARGGSGRPVRGTAAAGR